MSEPAAASITSMNSKGLAAPAALVAAILLALALALVWVYAPTLENGLVWDDHANLEAARASWGGGLSGIAWAFAHPFNGHYQPLTWLSYRLDLMLTGGGPRGMHLSQLVLHLLATLLVGALAWALAETPALRARPALASPFFPLAAAALFALAPVRVESVAWITERRDLLGTVLALAATLLHLRTSPQADSPGRYRLAVAGLGALSALARAQMSLPLVLLALDLWPLGRLSGEGGAARWRSLGRLTAEKAALFAVAAASAVAAMWAQADNGALTSLAEHGAIERGVQALYGLAFYPLAALVPEAWPGPLLPLYERPAPFPALAPEFLLPALFAAAALLAVAALARRAPPLAVATGAYVLLVLPVLGVAQSGIQLVADRYAYLATVPLVLLAAGLLARLFAAARLKGVWPAATVAAFLALFLAGDAVAARRQTGLWRDDLTLWTAVAAEGKSSLADNNLGQILAGRGESGQALFFLTRCLERTPTYPRPWRALAALLEAPWPAGAPEPAWVAATLSRALPYQPGLSNARFATALGLLRAGDAAAAEKELRRLLAIEPGHDGARVALARLAAARSAATGGQS